MTTENRSEGREGAAIGPDWDGAPVLLVEVDADGRAVAGNERWRAFVGLRDGSPSGDEWADRLHPEDVLTRSLWSDALRLGSPFEVECRLRDGEGRDRMFLVRADPRRDDAGTVASWLVVCTDVEHLHRARLELGRSNDELLRFAAVAGHDLLEPVRKARAFGERLAAGNGHRLDDRGRDDLDRMLRALARMGVLIRDVLDAARVGWKGRRPTVVALADVVADVVHDLALAIEREGGVVEVGLLPTIRGDRMNMYRVLQNLIANALKFARPGEPPRVRVSGWIEAGRCIVEVRDDGLGFAPEDADRIFESFQRIDGRRDSEGVGLGLAICRRIVEDHGGTITAEGAPGVGAVFRIVLPDGSVAT